MKFLPKGNDKSCIFGCGFFYYWNQQCAGGRKRIQKNCNGRVQNDLPPMWIGFVVLRLGQYAAFRGDAPFSLLETSFPFGRSFSFHPDLL
jgi:hypothetical protein